MQELVVGLIVAFAAWSILVRYTPKVVKSSVRRVTARALQAMGLRKAAEYIGRLQEKADCSSGCGSCGGCGPAPRSGGSTSKQSSTTPEALRRTARH